MGLFGARKKDPNGSDTTGSGSDGSDLASTNEASTDQVSTDQASTDQASTAGASAPGRQRKTGPTPTRREAEAARKARRNPSLSPRDARRRQSQVARQERMRALNARENTPEKSLMRNYVDARFRLGEILLPTLVLILALSLAGNAWPLSVTVSTVLLYAFIVVVLIDLALTWRGFKKVLAQRLPRSQPRGLLMPMANRCIQIRRFRMPAPVIKRGEPF